MIFSLKFFYFPRFRLVVFDDDDLTIEFGGSPNFDVVMWRDGLTSKPEVDRKNDVPCLKRLVS